MSARTTIRGPFAPLIENAGGVVAFAKLFNVHPATVWRWGTGRTVPGKAMREYVGAWAKARGLSAPW